MGDLGWGRFIYSSVFLVTTISWEVIKIAPSSASEVEVMTNLIIWARVRTDPFHQGMAYFLESKIPAPSMLRPLLSF